MTAVHAKRRQERHLLQVEKFKENKIVRDELLLKAKSITGLGTIGLQRLIGTLNINRLTDVVENRYLNAPWYLLRQKKAEDSNAKKTPKITPLPEKKKGSNTRVSEGSS
jgi:hypothetical protein